jgi:RHS repeat-associated protein
MGTDLGGAVDVVQTTSYYPFGLVMNQTNGNTAPDYQKNKYLCNGKELQDDVLAGSSLNWFDYGARFYDPQIGRWNVIDQLAEKFNDYSPYCYVGNNPISRFDPDGRDWATDKDKEKAKRLQEQSKIQIKNLEKSNSTLNQKISEAKEKGNEKKVARLEQQKGNNKSQIADLNKGIDEIQFLGDTEDYFFTYTYISGEGNNHVSLLKDVEKPLISIEHSTDALAMHESRHSFQYITEGKSSGRMVFDKNTSYLSYTSENATIWYETRAHQLQYSFSNSSLPMNASSFYGINKDWLKSLPGNPYKIK